MCDRYASEFAEFLQRRLADQGFNASSSRRLALSLDIMLGKKQVYQQQPMQFYFPELPQIQFFDRDQFPWLDVVEAATGDIRAELKEIMQQDSNAFAPYVEALATRARISSDAGLTASPQWSAFYLVRNGEVIERNAERCPKTMKAVEKVPFDRIPGKTPSVLFSQLLPGARIPPHTGFTNTRLICHLGVIVPEGCGFRVGNETREWQEGKSWVFDDTIQHEAWNHSRHTRVILLFDIWRPELLAEERRLVSVLLEAITAYRADPEEWKI